MKRLLISMFVLCLTACASTPDPQAIAAKRAEIDAMAKETLQALFEESSEAKHLYEQSYAYGVFSNLKASLFLTVGGGQGVIVKKASGQRTYMKMGMGGINIGLGVQKYQVVFLFETKTAYADFVKYGWQADVSANAVAGVEGANVGTTFRHGLAIFQLTDVGLMLQADISGTKYWENKKLNSTN